MIYRIVLLPLVCCFMGCGTITRDENDDIYSLDEEQIGEYTNEELIHAFAFMHYRLGCVVRSHSCDCTVSAKPWRTVLGSGCKDYIEILSNLSMSCDRLRNELNERSIPQKEKAEVIETIRRQWPQEMDSNERKHKEELLEVLLNGTELKPLHGVLMFYMLLHLNTKECDLDEAAFDPEGIVFIEEDIGIDLPDGSKGLKFHYKPPIDPIVFAKIKIPAKAQKAIETQIAALSGTHFPKDFANDRCDWWPSTPEHVILSKQAFNNGYYVELYLVKEKDDIILYIKYFTI